MQAPLLASKHRIPQQRPNLVPRRRLYEMLDEGMQGTLTLVSAPAGFGKSTLVSGWAAGCGRPVAWLSLDEGDNDPVGFLTGLAAALKIAAPNIWAELSGTLRSIQSPAIEPAMALILDGLSLVPNPFVLVLDDCHMVRAQPIKRALELLVEHLPSQAQLVMATREDPPLPLAKLRARGQLTELRGSDLRFNMQEASGYLNGLMALNLSSALVEQLKTRTEGWIAGLQLAAVSLRGHSDAAGFVHSFTGGHRFVLDYLVEEVMQRQSEEAQRFLIRTSVLDRMCGSLCEAVAQVEDGQGMLEYLERSNLFIVALDDERRWYRYHHLFADALRQRLMRHTAMAEAGEGTSEAELHLRASAWYESSGLFLASFRHAAAAQDAERAARLIEADGVSLLFRGAAAPVLDWLESLPTATLNANPSLLVTYASALLFASRIALVEPKLQAAEAALHGVALDESVRDIHGHIASIRATLAVSRHDAGAIMLHSRRALEDLHPGNLPVRAAATSTLAYAHLLQGDLVSAARFYDEALSSSREIGHDIVGLMSMLGIGSIQEANRQPDLAAATYRRALQHAGGSPHPIACEAYMGLARICLNKNELEDAAAYAQQGARLASFLAPTDRFVVCKLLSVRILLARGDKDEASALLIEAEQQSRDNQFGHLAPEISELFSLLQASSAPQAQTLIETLSERELEVLGLIAQGCSNGEISDRLFIALSSVKGHNQRIFGKLQASRRTEAVARARELGLL